MMIYCDIADYIRIH